MSEKDFYTAAALVASETLASLALPGGATLSKAVDGYLEGQRQLAISTLLDEIQSGYHGKVEFLPEDADSLIKIIHRYTKALEDGCAHENLKLLAQVIAGQKKNKALDPDEFRK